MQFDPLPSETRMALRRATAIVVDDVRKQIGADVVNKVLVTPADKQGDRSRQGVRPQGSQR
jgi:hypothetical protein